MNSLQFFNSGIQFIILIFMILTYIIINSRIKQTNIRIDCLTTKYEWDFKFVKKRVDDSYNNHLEDYITLRDRIKIAEDEIALMKSFMDIKEKKILKEYPCACGGYCKKQKY